MPSDLPEKAERRNRRRTTTPAADGLFDARSSTSVVDASFSRCPVCDSPDGELLVPPHPSRSITSGGIFVDAPLRKVQCRGCGLLRQNPHPESFKTELYRNRYALYHQRPGTSESEAVRYAAMAEWILYELGDLKPDSLLDVGCGGGILLDALRAVQPRIDYAGVDPSIENSAIARTRGFEVTTGFIPATKPANDRYDVVLAANVISHITDPIAFLEALALMTTPTGRVVLLSHDGVEPGADHLWADIEFSFCREHLGALGAKAGLELLASRGMVAPATQEDKHVLVFKRSASPAAVLQRNGAERDTLLEARRHYFEAWRQLAARLSRRADQTSGQLFNFGASFWSMLLAAYCPDYWRRVDACVVDSGSGTFLDKPLISTDSLPSSHQEVLVLGTNPINHAALKLRLSARADVVTWEDLIHR
jgi:SAM-dependent methyltransferase